MEGKSGRNEIPFNGDTDTIIPTEHISAAMRQIATDIGGEQLLGTINTLIETSDPELPSAAAISLLADSHPNVAEYIFTLSLEMYSDSKSSQTRRERRITDREERPKTLKIVGWGVIRALGAASGHYVPPLNDKPK